jgi:hypothetical protein
METDSPKQELTRKQLGQLRRQYITVVHGTVKACGHKAKFSATQQPKNNCVDCWSAYFLTSVDLEGIHVVLTKQGVRALVAQRGTKFVKMFRGFLSAKLLPALNAEAAKQEQGVTIEGGTIGNQGTEVQADSTTQQEAG